MRADRAARVCVQRCAFAARWAGQSALLVADLGALRSLGSRSPTGFPVAQRRAKHAGSLCSCGRCRRLPGPSRGGPCPARLGQGQKTVAGGHNVRSGEGKQQPAGSMRPPHFLFTRAEGITATSHCICGVFVIRRDSSDGLLEVTATAVHWSE